MSEENGEIVSLATAKDNPEYMNSGIKGQSNMGTPNPAGIALPPPKQKELNFERGVPFFFPFSTQWHDSWELFKTDRVSIPQLEVMRRTDPQARALFNLITLPIRAALKTAKIAPVDGMDGGEEEADFVDKMLNLPANVGGMEIPFNLVMAQMLLGVFHGFSTFELVYWVPDRGPMEGKYTIRKVAYRPPENLIVLLDSQGALKGWRQRSFFQGHVIDVLIPAEHSICYTCNASESLYYGVSMFEAAFQSYNAKQKLLYLAHLAAQKGALGTRVGHMPPNPNATDKNNFITQLKNFGINQYMAMPIDWDVTSLQETGHFDFLSLINYHNNQMSKSILAGFFDDDKGSGANDSTLVDFSKQDDSLFIQLLETVMDDIAYVINNQLIPRFIDWNFGTAKYPEFKWGPFTDEQKAAAQTIFNMLAVAGQNLTVSPVFLHELEKMISGLLGLPVDYDAQEQKWDQEQTQQAAIDKLNFEQSVAQTKQAITMAEQPVAAQPVAGQPATGAKPNTGNPSPNPPPPQPSPKVKPAGS